MVKHNKRLIVSSFLIVTALSTTGCSSLKDAVVTANKHHYGYTSYDPCIRCGESWTMLPNTPMAALKPKHSKNIEVDVPETVIEIE